MTLTMVSGNKDPSRVPTRTKLGESWIIGSVCLYLEDYPEGLEYTEVSVEDFIGSQYIEDDRVIDTTIGTGNLSIACQLSGTMYHGYSTDCAKIDLILERLESRLGVRARREREHIDLRFN